MTELDKAARAAMEAHVEVHWAVKLREWLDQSNGIFRTVVTIAAIAGLLTATYWEANNSGGGWRMLGKGVAPEWVCWISGGGFTLLYFTFHRVASEALRENSYQSPRFLKPAFAGLIFGVLSVAGVFANLVQNAEINQGAAQEASGARGELISEVRRLRAEVNSFDVYAVEAGLEADQRALAAAKAEAAGWGMADLEPDGACLDDLKPRQRQLCNMVNGADGLLASIAQGEAAKLSNDRSRKALDIAEAALESQPKAEAAQFWDGVGKVTGGHHGENTLVWFMLVVSLCTIVGTGIGWDAFFEAREGREG
ncbi:MAG TPA: hypothetical protein PLR76_12240 [Hyphomonas sp.]|nr:hypothetical protein [Hyphomonas sp.]